MKIPVLIISYLRIDSLEKVIQSVAAYKPDKIYLFSDGPKTKEEAIRVDEVRSSILKCITWRCQIFKNFNDRNLGCKYGPQTAITWLFESEKTGIILEDDTIPLKSFYPFVEELLERYKSDLRVWNIGGNNFFPDTLDTKTSSYYFSRFAYTWGWATWADRWRIHLEKMATFEEDARLLQRSSVVEKPIINNWVNYGIKSVRDELDAWDYIWSLRVFMSNGLSVVPRTNLIDYQGYGAEATHTTVNNCPEVISEDLMFPLKHPRLMKANYKKDMKLFEDKFNWKSILKKVNLKHINAVIKSRISKF